LTPFPPAVPLLFCPPYDFHGPLVGPFFLALSFFPKRPVSKTGPYTFVLPPQFSPLQGFMGETRGGLFSGLFPPSKSKAFPNTPPPRLPPGNPPPLRPVQISAPFFASNGNPVCPWLCFFSCIPPQRTIAFLFSFPPLFLKNRKFARPLPPRLPPYQGGLSSCRPEG